MSQIVRPRRMFLVSALRGMRPFRWPLFHWNLALGLLSLCFLFQGLNFFAQLGNDFLTILCLR
jgi:hypothetical protein